MAGTTKKNAHQTVAPAAEIFERPSANSKNLELVFGCEVRDRRTVLSTKPSVIVVVEWGSGQRC